MPVVKAAFAYVLPVFALGFVLGVLRTLVTAPRLGEATAILVEVPAMLLASWFAAGWAIRRFRIADRLADRIRMGGLAFALLILAEILLGWLLGASPARTLATMTAPARLPGLAAQLLFAAIPALRLLRP